jgi:CRISPR-associated endonuclease/helicase Cas3
VNQRLSERLPIILVSTQLIEAGVDISLGCVVRSAAGLDSIAQAAGRCNRHGEQEIAPVYVVQLADEKLSKLPDIQKGQTVTLSMFDQQQREQSSFDPLNPQTQQDFFQRYYSAQTADNREQLLYPLKDKSESSLVNLLSRNRNFSNELKDNNNYQGRKLEWMLRQSFMMAGKAFQAIDAPTRPIIVSLMQADPKNDSPLTGRELVSELSTCQLPQDYQRWNQLMKHAQRFTINLFDHEFNQLCNANAVFRVHSQEEVFALSDTFIDEKLGWTTEVMSCGEFF